MDLQVLWLSPSRVLHLSCEERSSPLGCGRYTRMYWLTSALPLLCTAMKAVYFTQRHSLLCDLGYRLYCFIIPSSVLPTQKIHWKHHKAQLWDDALDLSSFTFDLPVTGWAITLFYFYYIYSLSLPFDPLHSHYINLSTPLTCSK